MKDRPATLLDRSPHGSFLFSVTTAFRLAYPGSFASSNYLVMNDQGYGPSFGAGADC